MRAKMKHLLLGVVLLAGLVYSVLALNVTPAYAVSCDCSNDQLEAENYCNLHFRHPDLSYFACAPNGAPDYFFRCFYDPNQALHYGQCLD